jgi:hypothetical protein
MPNGYTNDLSVYKTQQVLVYDSTGNFIDTLRDAPLLTGFKEVTSGGTSPIRVQLPRPMDNFDQDGVSGNLGTIGQGNIIKYYLYGPGLPTTGLLRYQGYIDTIEPEMNEHGEEFVAITIMPFSSVLGDRGCSSLVQMGIPDTAEGYVDILDMMKFWFNSKDPITNQVYTYPLVIDAIGTATTSGVEAYSAFYNQNLDSVFQTLTLLLPSNWFYRFNPENTVTINVASTTAQHTLVIGQHITNPQYRLDYTNLKNVVVYTGYTPSTDATGLSELNQGDPVEIGGQPVPIQYIAIGGSVLTMGERIAYLNNSRITDMDTLQTLAEGTLAQLNRVAIRAKIRVPDYRGGNGGYDIESFRVGDTIQIVNPDIPMSNKQFYHWDTDVWDTAYWDYKILTSASSVLFEQVLMIVGMDYGFDYVDIELDTLQPNLIQRFYNLYARVQDYTTI